MAEATPEIKISPKVPNEKLDLIARREETRLNSLLLKDKDVLLDCIESGISLKFFQDETQRQLFSVIARYYDSHDSILTRQQFETVVSQLKTDEEAAAHRTAFDSTFAEQVSAHDYSALKGNMEGRHMQREALSVFSKFYDSLLKTTSGQKKMVESIQNDIMAITSLGGNAYNRAISLAEILKTEVIPEIEQRRDHPEDFIGMMTGWNEIDRDFNGFVKGRYLVVLAMEGGGKTTFMLNLAMNFALHGKNVCYVTIESPAKDTATRLLTIHSTVNYNRIMRGGRGQEDGLCDYIMDELKGSANSMIAGPASRFHLIQAIDGTSRKEILGLVNRKRAFTDIDVLFVDYLQVVGKESSHPGRPDLELADVSGGFRSWGMENGILVATAQQLKSDKSKKLTDLKVDDIDADRINITDTSGTKQISGAADYMLGVVIPEGKDRMRIDNAKFRQGVSQKSYVLSFDPDSGKLDNMPDSFGYSDIGDGLKGAENRKNLEYGGPATPEQMESLLEDAIKPDLGAPPPPPEPPPEAAGQPTEPSEPEKAVVAPEPSPEATGVSLVPKTEDLPTPLDDDDMTF
jgi:replicative DNA helicase